MPQPKAAGTGTILCGVSPRGSLLLRASTWGGVSARAEKEGREEGGRVAGSRDRGARAAKVSQDTLPSLFPIPFIAKYNPVGLVQWYYGTAGVRGFAGTRI